MHKFKSLFISLALLSSLPVAVWGEDKSTTLTLEQLVSNVLESSPELQFYQSEIAAAKGELSTAGTLQNPELSTQLGRKREFESGLAGEGTAWSVSVSQTFEYPGRMALRKAIAGNQVKLAEIGLARFRAALAAKARSLGYEVATKQELADAANNVADRGQELIGVLVQRDPAGVTPLLETRIIEASVIKLKRQANEAQKEAQSALFSLNQLRGTELQDKILITATDINLPTPPGTEELIESARTANFELQMQETELEGQGFKVALSKNERLPAVSVAPFYSEEEAGGSERTFGIGLTVPLPLWNQNTGNIETSRAREDQARTSLHLTKRRVEQELREKALSYRLHLSEVSRWQPNVISQLREAAELGDRHYRLGSLPVATYVELQKQYLEALEAIYETKAEALNAIQDLEVLTGKTFVTFNKPQGGKKAKGAK